MYIIFGELILIYILCLSLILKLSIIAKDLAKKIIAKELHMMSHKKEEAYDAVEGHQEFSFILLSMHCHKPIIQRV